MKILLTTHQFFPKHGSGTEVLARDAGLEMLERGHEVHVLTVDPGVQADSEEVDHEDYEHRGLKVRALGLPRPPKPIDLIRYEYDNDPVARHVRRYLEEVTPDVAHIFHAARLSASIIDVFKRAGLPVIYTSTDFWAICVTSTLRKPSGELSEGPDEISSNCLECRQVGRSRPVTHVIKKFLGRKNFYRKMAEHALARRKWEHPKMAQVREMLARTEFLRERFNSVDAILAPTKLMHKMLTANGIDPDLVSLSPYGINVSRFRDGGFSRNGTGGLRFGYIGTIHPQKGLHILIEAFKSLPREVDTSLRVCGSLAHFPEYAREVYDMARSDPRINFAGTYPNEKIAEEMKKIDVLVVPSTWYENAPVVIYEAFAGKVPVVATNLEGMSEVVRHEENGLLFELGDVQDLARQLKRLIDEPDSLRRYSGNVGNVRTVEDSVDEMLDLYERLRKEKAQERERARKASRSTEEWLWLNYEGIKENPSLKEFVAPFPPAELMHAVSGLTDELDFAAHGVHIYKALLRASPVPWKDLPITLDFGCGCGRVARLFKDHDVELHGVDIDDRYIEWIRANLPYVKAVAKEPNDPLPYPDNTFDAIYSISVLSHVDEEYHNMLLSELARVSKPGALLFLSVHGERAFERAVNEKNIMDMLNIDELLFQRAAEKFRKGEHAFILQRQAPLTTDEYRYGITFIPASYIRRHWDKWFEVVEIRDGAIHNFQDIVVLRTK